MPEQQGREGACALLRINVDSNLVTFRKVQSGRMVEDLQTAVDRVRSLTERVGGPRLRNLRLVPEGTTGGSL